MTPARKAALKWFHDRGTAWGDNFDDGSPSIFMIRRMLVDGQLDWTPRKGYSLTDKGRRMFNGDQS